MLGKDGDEQDWHNKEVLHFPPTLLMYEPQVEFILLLYLFCTLQWEMFPMVLQFFYSARRMISLDKGNRDIYSLLFSLLIKNQYLISFDLV